VSDLSTVFGDPDSHCSLVIPADLPPVVADPVLVRECLANLVHNADEANRENGADGGDICLALQRYGPQAGWLEVRIRDRGPGLPAELREDLDRPLFTTKPDGLGLGLAICRTVVEAHGGRLWATANDPEPGTTFHFTLPAASGA
jgi:signal transduction histidine kinase